MLPRTLALHQNYPNPFNPSTVISYDIPPELEESEMLLTVYDIRGRKVRTLRSESVKAGQYQVTWDGRDDRGKVLSSGIYLYRLQIGSVVETKRMVILK
jgi:flagellar hook assembly protein FlgD